MHADLWHPARFEQAFDLSFTQFNAIPFPLMSFDLISVDRRETVDRETFRREYLKPGRPLVLTGLSRAWPALDKWTMDYFKQVAGDKQVPVYDGSKANASKKVNQPDAWMKFSEYLDLISTQPTDLRIFTFNIFSNVPELVNDYANPEVCGGFVDRFPLMFFGGAGSKVFLHFDIDVSNIFLTQFHGSKRVLLFGPDQTPRLYKLPLSFHGLEDIDWANPDFDRFPALRGVKGQTTVLNHGDTLFMPSKWWHHMEYLQGGFAISLRAVPSPVRLMNALWNVFFVRYLDNACRRALGQKWFDWKESAAVRKSNDYARRYPARIGEASVLAG